MALYEICARYRDNPSGVTSRKPIDWWTDALNQAPGGLERREWRKFKSERVKPALDEINRETDIEIELIEHRQGRTVTEVQFAVRRKRAPLRGGTTASPVDANLVLRAESLGIREIKLDGLLTEFDDAAVRVKLDVLERRIANNRLSPVDDAYSYLRTLLRTDAAVVVDPSVSVNPVTIAAAVKPALIQNPVIPRQEVDARVQADWMNAKIAEVRQELMTLPVSERKVWVDQAIKELSSKGTLSAVIVRRAAQGDVLHGLLGSVIVRLYATAVHGESWNRYPSTDRSSGQELNE